MPLNFCELPAIAAAHLKEALEQMVRNGALSLVVPLDTVKPTLSRRWSYAYPVPVYLITDDDLPLLHDTYEPERLVAWRVLLCFDSKAIAIAELSVGTKAETPSLELSQLYSGPAITTTALLMELAHTQFEMLATGYEPRYVLVASLAADALWFSSAGADPLVMSIFSSAASNPSLPLNFLPGTSYIEQVKLGLEAQANNKVPGLVG